jgi:hypothetical protein
MELSWHCHFKRKQLSCLYGKNDLDMSFLRALSQINLSTEMYASNFRGTVTLKNKIKNALPVWKGWPGQEFSSCIFPHKS